ncbi:hypothetical protein HG531_010174 [Fusarium graminearum]|nr:hypothetical protein HG531_010174 [Fusarium graminearum]
MLIVFLYTFLYDVKSLFATGSPTESSTPGGIERGVRPSLEGRFEVVEKGAAVARGAAVACHAGTKKPGSVTGPDDDAVMARPNAFPRLGANMAAIGVDMAVVGVLQCWLAPRTMFRPLKLNFSDKIVHVGLGLSELHLIHTLTSVPMQESLASEHSSKLLANTLEKLLDRGGVSNKSGRHILALDVAHLVLNLLHGDTATEDGRAGQVTTVAEVRGSHHVLGVEHLLGELRNADSAERVSTTAGQGSESDHEEVQTGEGHHVDGELSEVRVQLTGETETGSDAGHDGRDKVVQVAVRGVGQLEGAHANVVEGLIVDTKSFVGVLDQLMDGEGGVVGLDNGVGDLGGRNDGESCHHTVGEFLTDLGDQQGTHTGAGTTTKRVGDLETLEAVTALGLTADDIENLVDKFSTLGVMTLGPVVSGAGLTENEVVGSEKLSEGTSTDGVHGTGLEIDEDGTGNILVTGGLHA